VMLLSVRCNFSLENQQKNRATQIADQMQRALYKNYTSRT
jgi:hypothetical protein